MPDSMGLATFAEEFVEALNKKFPVVHSTDTSFGVIEGKRFDKIVNMRDGSARGVYAFVERSTGRLIKPAGWSTPARKSNGEFQSQYSLGSDDDLAQAVEAADRFGRQLYIR